MKVSIITPSFNNGEYLDGNIKCLLDQTYKPHEHIIMDGGSTDSTIDLLKSYDHIQWISEPDDGMYDAINKGLQKSTGDIIAYLNADDRYFKHTLDKVVDFFEKNPDVDFVYGDCTYMDKNEKEIVTFKALPYVPIIIKSSYIRWAQMSCFWRREVHNKIGYFNNNMKNVGDFEFFKRMLFQNLKGAHIAEPLSKFMIRIDAITFTLGENYYKEIKDVFEKYPSNKIASIINVLFYYLINIKNLIRYLIFYIPYRHGGMLPLIKKKLFNSK